MTNKFLVGIGAAFFSVFVLGAAAVVGINAMSEQASRLATTIPAESLLPTTSSPSHAPGVQSLDQPIPVVAPALTAPQTQGSPQDAPVTVLDSDLEKLAAAVKLGSANTGDVGKDVWAREVPVAQKLLQGLCDCDQRNWLKHFVETGNQAVSGSEEYYQSIQLLATLRRSDKELTAAQASH